MTQVAEADAELLQDRLELLRLRTLLVGTLGIVGLVAGLVALLAYGSQALKLAGQALVFSTEGFHVPGNLFQAPADTTWARSPVLLQLAFLAIGIGGIAQMTRQILSTVQIRLWLAVLCGLALFITYTQSNIGSVWHPSQRELVKAVRAKEWARVEQLSSTSQNPVAHAYVMAQVGLAKPDAALLQLHGKALVDRIDDVLMRRGQDPDYGLLNLTDEFRPEILKDIDVAVYGAPHTQIGLSLTSAARAARQEPAHWVVATTLLAIGAATAGLAAAVALLLLWRRMTARLRRLRPWVMAAG